MPEIGHDTFRDGWLEYSREHLRYCRRGSKCAIREQMAAYLQRHYKGTALAEAWLDGALAHVAFCPDPDCHFNAHFQEAAARLAIGPVEYAAELRRVQEGNERRALDRYLRARGEFRGGILA